MKTSCNTPVFMQAVLVAWCLATIVQAAESQASTWLIVETPPAAQRLQDELLRSQQNLDWEHLFSLSRMIIQEHPTALFEYQPGHHVDARSLRTLMIRSLPVEGQQAYLASIEAEVVGMFQAGMPVIRPGFVPAKWLRLLEGYPGTNDYTAVCLQMGDLDWHAGELKEAIEWWLRGLQNLSDFPRPAANDLQVPLIVRLGTARSLQGRFESAREIRRTLEHDFADAEVSLAGSTGPAAEILDQVLKSSENQARWRSSWARDLEPVERLWKTDLKVSEELVEVAVDRFRPSSSCNCLPGHWQGKIILPENGRVRILDLLTGAPAWPTGLPQDTGIVYESTELPAALFPTVPPPLLPGRIDNSDWLGTVNYSALQPGQSVAGYTRLVTLDLQAEGRLRWAVDSRSDWMKTPDTVSTNRSWIYSSSPVVQEDEVIIVLRSFGAVQGIGILFLNRLTGEVNSFLPINGGAALQQRQVPVDELLLTDDQLLVMLGGEWLVSISRDHKMIRWTRRLEQQRSTAAVERILPQMLDDSRMLYVAGPDSIVAIEAETGAIIWNAQHLTPLSGLVGIEDQLLLAVGTHAWGIHARTGKIIWRAGADDESAPVSTPVTLANHTLLWERDESIWVLNPQTGRLLQRLPWQQLGVRQLQSIQIQGNELILTQPGSLTAIEVLWQTSPE